MTMPVPQTDRPNPLRQMIRVWGALALIIALCCAAEAMLLGADWRLWGSPIWRSESYQYGAFWAGLLHGWRPNYATQPLLMFVTYPFLHSGPSHLIGNMLSLGWLGQIALTRLGTRGFLLLYLFRGQDYLIVYQCISDICSTKHVIQDLCYLSRPAVYRNNAVCLNRLVIIEEHIVGVLLYLIQYIFYGNTRHRKGASRPLGVPVTGRKL